MLFKTHKKIEQKNQLSGNPLLVERKGQQSMWRNKRVHQPSGLEHHSYIFKVVGDPGSIPGMGRIIYLIINSILKLGIVDLA